MIPLIKSSPLQSLEISDFSGGVNYAMEENIKSNQFRDIDNMWFQQGVLKTRPNVKTLRRNDTLYEYPNIFTDNKNSVFLDNKRYFLEVMKETTYNYRYNISLVNDRDSIRLGSVSFQKEITFFISVFRDNIYLFVSNNKIYISEFSENKYLPLREVLEHEIYSPLVLTNCRSCFMDSGKINAMILRGAQKFEHFNFLSNRYRMEFSQYDTQNYIEANEGQVDSRISYMEYGLPYTNKNCSGQIFLEYVDISGKIHKHSVLCPTENTPSVERTVGDDGLYLHAFFKGDVCHVTLNGQEDAKYTAAQYVSILDYVNNNLIIDAPREKSYMEKITLMTEAVWYGNNSLGVNGGSRLFLGGNPQEKNLLLWSDFESPLYFPECNYAYVGDKNQKITALDKQGSSLIIFKEREIYSSQYKVGETESSKHDITLGEAYFPIKLIHPNIGCNEKNSIQLLFNRLTFLASNNKVCTIKEENQFSEINIFSVSETIAPKLKDIKNVKSADWNGFYMLFYKNQVFLMDYNTYGYMNIHSQNGGNSADTGIPWYVWTLPQEIEAVENYENKILLWVTTDFFVNIMTFSDEAEDAYFVEKIEGLLFQEEIFKKIHSKIETKRFDFNEPHRLKSISAVYLDVLGDPYVTFITDKNRDTQNGFYLVPEKRTVKSLGILIESDEKLKIFSLNVFFRKGGNLWQKVTMNI